ncbi:LysM peptidoglycan-binding domain-containing protein [Andreprevotia chitinilytica]|uniref:LysM peptidoglycan-binding domain-containing protein n=1 Tax=Andreprevotia chitinilytica TaxID=396808 RepID=UPI000554393B|nr:peptidoglycan DD-metalloendopeptidase family protein [Andreprevotia chitinilytica]
MTQTYTVQKGDTLWGISRHFNTDIHLLARLNGLRGEQANRLTIGQQLTLPENGEEPDTELTIRLLDLAYRPLAKATLKLEFDNKSREHTTDGDGKTPILPVHDRSYGLKVHYRERDGSYTVIANHPTLPLGRKTLTLTSRKMVMEGTTAPKERSERTTTQQVREQLKQDSKPLILQPRKDVPPPPAQKPPTTASMPTAKPAPTAAAMPAAQQRAPTLPPERKPEPAKPIEILTRTEGGAPTHIAAPGFAKENLKLHPINEKFGQFILDSARKYGFTPQALAAVIDAEVGAEKHDREWNPKEVNPNTKARGLGQFIEAAWFDVCAIKGSAVNTTLCKTYSQYHRFIAKKGRLYGCRNTAGKDKKGNPITREAEEVISNCREILEWRNNAEIAIEAAAAYGAHNLRLLQKNGFPVDKLTPSDKAKVIYLAHHEGFAGALRALRGTDTDAAARARLIDQVNTKANQYFADFDNSAVKAYLFWLYVDLVDRKVDVTHFAVKPEQISPPRNMSDIAIAFGGGPAPAMPPGMRARRDAEAAKAAEKEKTKQAKQAVQLMAPKGAANSSPKAKPTARPQAQNTQTSTVSSPPTTTSDVAKNNKQWRDPLDCNVLRTAKLAGIIGACYGDNVRTDEEQQPKAHQGIDLASAIGTPVYAVAPGLIVAVDKRFTSKSAKSFGANVLLQVNVNDLPATQRAYYLSQRPHDTILYFFYAHLSRIDVTSDRNKNAVSAGDLIGATGCSGNAHRMNTVNLGAHLHFEVRFRKGVSRGLDGRVDPLPFLLIYPQYQQQVEQARKARNQYWAAINKKMLQPTSKKT